MYNDFMTLQKADIKDIQLKESMAYENDCWLNRIWYIGDAYMIEQMMKALERLNGNDVSKDRFWAAVPVSGMGIRKIHSGLPQEMVNTITDIIVSDMDKIKVNNTQYEKTWEEFEAENDFKELIQQAITETLVVGDGAFKISFNYEISDYPIVEFYSGDAVKYDYKAGRIIAVRFYTRYKQDKREYILEEVYKRGGIEYHLYNSRGKETTLDKVDELAELKPVEFEDKTLLLAIPCMFYKSAKYEGRGKSIYDNKTELFDAYDEAISAWTDAERDNRAKNYIPEDLLPKDPETGEGMEPNSFLWRFIRVQGSINLGENSISTSQSNIDYQAHEANIISKRDQCIEGIISGATLGFNVSADASGESQKEKKDTTIITRNHITTRLEKIIRNLVKTILRAYYITKNIDATDIDVDFTFGEYSKQSFDDKIKTLASARPGEAIISREAVVDELWGDSKDEKWKAEEVLRLETDSTIIDETPLPFDDEKEDEEDISSENI